MNAFVLKTYGSPASLELQEVPKPAVAEDEVRVKVRATAINDWDWTFVRGVPWAYRPFLGLLIPKVKILGAEVAGEVEAVGKRVRKLRVGDSVYGDISGAGFGAFAEYVSVRETALTPKPPRMSFEEAAAIPHAALLAYQGLVELGAIRDGQKVLINGAGGGVGTLGVQIAKQHDVEVTGVDSGEKLDLLRSVGFDRVIDYRQEDFTRNAARYDLILDTKSDRSVFAYRRALAPGGTYVTVGGQTARLLQTLFVGKGLSWIGGRRLRVLALAPNRGLEQMSQLYEAGKLKCVIDGPYPFSDIPRAIQYFGEARHQGKVVISLAAGGLK